MIHTKKSILDMLFFTWNKLFYYMISRRINPHIKDEKPKSVDISAI